MDIKKEAAPLSSQQLAGRQLAARLAVVGTLLILPLFAIIYWYIQDQNIQLKQLKYESASLGIVKLSQKTNTLLTDEILTNLGKTPNDWQKIGNALTALESAIAQNNELFVHLESSWQDLMASYKGLLLLSAQPQSNKQKTKVFINKANEFSGYLQKINQEAVSLAGIGSVNLKSDAAVQGDKSKSEINTLAFMYYQSSILKISLQMSHFINTEEKSNFTTDTLQKTHKNSHGAASHVIQNVAILNIEESAKLAKLNFDFDSAITLFIKGIGRMHFMGVSDINVGIDYQQPTLTAIRPLNEQLGNNAQAVIDSLITQIKSRIRTINRWIIAIIMAIASMVIFAFMLAFYIFKGIHFTQHLLNSHNKDLEEGIAKRTQELTLAKNKMEELIVELKVESKKADAANQAKSLFLASMSHEIRTPLNAIIGGTALMAKGELNEKQYDTLRLVNSSGRALLDLINEILDFSKIEAGEMTIESTEFNLEDIFIDVANMFELKAREKCINIIMDFSLACENQWLGDPTRIRQILINLVSNALKFTEEGGITLIAHYKDESLLLQVIDTGIGMHQKAQDKLFQSFTQADSSTTRKYGGTGLGLSICRSLCELMRGEISVKSEIDVGSTFTVNLPITKLSATDDIFDTQLTECQKLNVTIIHGHNFAHKRLKEWGFNLQIKTLSELLHEVKSEMVPRCDVLILNGYYKEEDIKILKSSFTNTPVIQTGVEQEHMKKYVQEAIVSWPKGYQARELLINLAQGKSTKVKKQQSVQLHYQGDILLVEDVAFNRIIASEFLIDFGLAVEFAEDGKQAVEACKKKRYSLIFMDLHMPIMNGIEATKAIRNYEIENSLIPTPIIALTADVMQDTYTAVYQAGMDDFITKPFEEEKLNEVLSRYLPKYCQLKSVTFKRPQSNQEEYRNQASPQPDPPPKKQPFQPVSTQKNTLQAVPESPTKKPMSITPQASDDSNLIFDYPALEKRVRHKRERATRLVNAFRAEQEQYLYSITHSAHLNDFKTLASQSHALKGVSANLGLMKVSYLAGAIELSAQSLEQKTQALSQNQSSTPASLVTIPSPIQPALAQPEQPPATTLQKQIQHHHTNLAQQIIQLEQGFLDLIPVLADYMNESNAE